MKQNAPFGLRMPNDLKAWLAARAEANCRSMNNELIAMMKATQASEQSKGHDHENRH